MGLQAAVLNVVSLTLPFITGPDLVDVSFTLIRHLLFASDRTLDDIHRALQLVTTMTHEILAEATHAEASSLWINDVVVHDFRADRHTLAHFTTVLCGPANDIVHVKTTLIAFGNGRRLTLIKLVLHFILYLYL